MGVVVLSFHRFMDIVSADAGGSPVRVSAYRLSNLLKSSRDPDTTDEEGTVATTKTETETGRTTPPETDNDSWFLLFSGNDGVVPPTPTVDLSPVGTSGGNG